MRLSAWLIGSYAAGSLVWPTSSQVGTCPAGGTGPGCPQVSADDRKCVRWRQTGGCNPKGPRERHGDKGCDELIPTGASGYCQCGSGNSKLKAREVSCDHRPFKCSTECLQYDRYTCKGWRQTGACDSDGPREQHLDRPCDATIDATMSGFCECGDGRIIRKPGCKVGEFEEPFRCRDECAHEADLYEELGVDKGATDKAIKQAFRKMSLRYHPDKTRGDPALTARFSQIREAYEILADEEQRGMYDSLGLKLVYEQSGQQKASKAPAMNMEMTVTLDALYNGQEVTTTVGRKVICRGCADNHTPRCNKCTTQCANELELRNIQMGPMVMQQQVEVPSRQRCRHENVNLLVSIERGMASGDTLKFKGRGEQQPKKIPGDVVLKLKMENHKTFNRIGNDLHMNMEITLVEALLGFKRSLTHLDGRRLELGFSGVTKPFGIMRIEGEGMPHRGDPTQSGNLFIRFTVLMPQDGDAWFKEQCLTHAGR